MTQKSQARAGILSGGGGSFRPARQSRRRPRSDAVPSRSRRSAEPRQLRNLISIGPAMLRDFQMLGIHSVAQLAKQEPRKMYERLNRKTRQWQDPCVLDTFCAAVAQARNPRLPAEQCEWWYWSRKRKSTARR
jgi:hypothetical protein